MEKTAGRAGTLHDIPVIVFEMAELAQATKGLMKTMNIQKINSL